MRGKRENADDSKASSFYKINTFRSIRGDLTPTVISLLFLFEKEHL